MSSNRVWTSWQISRSKTCASSSTRWHEQRFRSGRQAGSRKPEAGIIGYSSGNYDDGGIFSTPEYVVGTPVSTEPPPPLASKPSLDPHCILPNDDLVLRSLRAAVGGVGTRSTIILDGETDAPGVISTLDPLGKHIFGVPKGRFSVTRVREAFFNNDLTDFSVAVNLGDRVMQVQSRPASGLVLSRQLTNQNGV